MSKMSTLKIAMIACGLTLGLVAGAQAYDLRIGNGTSVVTVNPSSNGAAYATGNGRGERSAVERPFGPANGAR
jgi:hypothetical protein